MIVIRHQLFIRYSSYYVLLLIVYILRCPPVIKIDKSLTYSVCLFPPLFHSHKKKNSQKKWHQRRKQIVMVGEYSEESIKEIKVVLLEYFGRLHKKEHQQKEKRNEISPVLEFLESNFCRLVNSPSYKMF